MAKLKFDPSTMKVVRDGVAHAIVEVWSGHAILNGPDKGKPSTQFGILVKKSQILWGGKLYFGWNPKNSFVQDRFDKLEGMEPKAYESARAAAVDAGLLGYSESIMPSPENLRRAMFDELIAFNLCEGLSMWDALALERRLDKIFKAALAGKPIPKPSTRFWKALRGSTDALNFLPANMKKHLRLVPSP